MSGELGKDAGKEIGERPGVQRLGRRIFEAPGGDGVNEVCHEWGGRSEAEESLGEGLGEVGVSREGEKPVGGEAVEGALQGEEKRREARCREAVQGRTGMRRNRRL